MARVNPTADAATGQVRIVVTLPNVASLLVTGLFAEGRVAFERRRGVTAPIAAVDARGVKPSVLRIRNGVVERVEVELGVRDDEEERYEIVAGVSAGDTLLVGTAQGISPGTTLRVSAPADRPPTRG